jgi:very-short-patch-repair endonuclease
MQFRREVRQGTGASDFFFPRERVAVEVDGPHHRAATWRAARDLQKAEQLCARGILTVRLTNAEVLASPAAAAQRIANVLLARELGRTMSQAGRRRTRSRTSSRRRIPTVRA